MSTPNITLLVFGAALEKLAVDADQLRQLGVTTVHGNEVSTLDFPVNNIDCVLFDGNGQLKLTAEEIIKFRSLNPRSKLLVSRPQSMVNAMESLKSGAVGLLNQALTAEQFAEILSRIQAGHYYLDQEIAQQLAIRQMNKLLEPFTGLTSREFDVFCMLSEGLSLQEMAKQLGVSSKTVSNCQSQIKSKLGLHTREAIEMFAKTHGLGH